MGLMSRSLTRLRCTKERLSLRRTLVNSATHYTLLRAELQHPRMLGSPSFCMNVSTVRRGRSWVELGGDDSCPQTRFPCGTTLVSVGTLVSIVSDVSVVSVGTLVSIVSDVSVVSVGTLV